MVMEGQVKQTYLTLNNGVQMPQFGLGVYSIPDGDETYNSVMTALKCGYACTAIFPLLSFIEQHVKKCRHREQIYPVFTQTETKVDFVLKARIMPFFLLSGILGTLIKALKALEK